MANPEVKVGDRIKLVGDRWWPETARGAIVGVTELGPQGRPEFTFDGAGRIAGGSGFEYELVEDVVKPDAINPAHYQGFSNGAQVVDITEHLSFCAGNAIKYLARAGKKDPAKHVEDLEKAAWFVQREIQRVKAGE